MSEGELTSGHLQPVALIYALRELAFEAIREAIISRDPKPGQHHGGGCQRLGVSRTPFVRLCVSLNRKLVVIIARKGDAADISRISRCL